MTMEPIEELWNPPSSPDIMSDLWMNISDAKKAIKIWILDRGESWGHATQNNKTRLQLHCILDSTDPTERRYPLRKRQLTVKAAALIIE